MIETRLILIAIACVLISAVSFIVFKYRKLHGRKEAEMDKEDVLGRLFLRKLSKIEATVGKEDPEQIFKKLNKMMRSFFSELYDIRYQFDYLELNEELGKKGVKEGIRKDIIELTMQMSRTEYSGQKITNIVLYPLIEKSAGVMNKVTGQEPEPLYKKPPAEQPPAVKEVPPTEPPRKEVTPPAEKIPPEKKEPLTEPPRKEVTPPAEQPPAEEAKPAAEPLPPEKEKPPAELPVEKRKEAQKEMKEEEAAEQKIIIPPDDKGKIDKMKRQLLEAEQELRSKDYENAMDSYTELKGIYDSLSPDVKASVYDEIKRIIDIYNTLLKEYKDTLLGKK